MDKIKYKHSKETREKMSKTRKEFYKNNSHPRGMKGKKNKWGNHSEETKKKMSKAKKGNHYPKLSEAHLGIRYSREVNLKKGIKGEKNGNWKGGVSKVNHKIRTSFEYRLWIKFCMERDNYLCKYCEEVGGNLEVHHLKPLFKIIEENNIKNLEDARKCEELWDLDNGITLCSNCHIKIDERRGAFKC